MAFSRSSHALACFVVFAFICVSSVYCGECCKAFQDITGETQPPKWCSDYCCHDPKTLLLSYDCCDNEILRADADMRDSFCVQWWAAHLYVPILIGVAVLVIVLLTCCCCCCCCGCCRKQQPGYIVQNQPAGQVVMVQQQQQQQIQTSDAFHVGYDQ